MRVLIINDGSHLIRAFKHNLTKSGYVIEEASDNTDALVKIKQNVPDLVLTDIWSGGYELLKILRTEAGFIDLRIIITGSSPPIPDRHYPVYERHEWDNNSAHLNRVAAQSPSVLLRAVTDILGQN